MNLKVRVLTKKNNGNRERLEEETTTEVVFARILFIFTMGYQLHRFNTADYFD
jgi:hypothetical protein